MDRAVAARKLVTELIKGEQIEIRRAEIVGRDLAQWIEESGRTPSGRELEDWLGEHAQVTELYASPTLLDELIYRHLAPPEAPAVAAADAHHPELEAQLRADPDAVEPYLVYADFLQEHGDPMGELIALGVKAASGAEDDVARFERHRKLHEARFLGGLAGQLAALSLEWRNGMVCAIDEVADTLKPSVWEQMLKLRVFGFVQAITLRHSASTELATAIASSAAPTLRDLTLLNIYAGVPEPLLERALRTLVIEGFSLDLVPTTFRAPIERLELRVTYLKAATGAEDLRLDVRELYFQLNAASRKLLGKLALPRLERLELGLDEIPGDDLSELVKQLAVANATHLVLCDGRLEPDTFAAIAKLPIAKRITKLGLTSLELTDEMLAAMVKTRGGFKSLVELDVSFNELSRDGLAAARRLAPNVISTRQHKRGSGMELRVRRFAGSRLQVAEGIADPKYWKRAGVDGNIRWARYSGDASYELYISRDLSRYNCSCPSSIQPCKHVVALALVDERTGLREAPAEGLVERVGERPNYALPDDAASDDASSP